MSRKVADAIAHPNIALAKYWGKRAGTRDVPAVPSLSVTLGGLATRTRVIVDSTFTEDSFELGGKPAAADVTARTSAWLAELRTRAGSGHFARVESQNDFPTSSGLASSASGFAALAVAAAHAYGLDLDRAALAALAQRGSTSAARSLFSGFAELVPDAPAAQVAPAEHLPLAVLVCVTTEAEKDISSRSAMARTIAESPYYEPWVRFAHENFAVQRAALLARDWDRLGPAIEKSAFAMHASAMAAGIVYFNDTTLRLAARVRALREQGISAWSSMDAGPHVKVFLRADDVATARAVLENVPGVVRIITATPGVGARLAEADAS